jgi:hypothetical protein
MRVILPIALGSAATLSQCLIGQAPVARWGPLPLPDPWVNTSIINVDGNGATITKIQQCEVRSVGGGNYRIAATVQLLDPATNQTTPDSTLITGNLNLSVSPPVWTPNLDVAALSRPGTSVDEYQLSISADGLTAVWDRYDPQPPNTFCCRRSSTSVPFSNLNTQVVQGVGTGGVDPHIGEELPNGHVMLYHIFASALNNFASAPIAKADLDPVTGALGTPTVVATYTGAGVNGFNHSPFVFRDSAGKARAVAWSENPASGPQHSNAFFSEGVNDDGTPEIILDGTPTSTWFNNPGLVGGTWHYCTSARTEPQLQEVTLLANADLTSGSGSVVAWAPVRPQPGAAPFFSIVIAGIDVRSVSAPPYQVPPINGDIWVFVTLGDTGIQMHDMNSGIAEWHFSGLTPLHSTWALQLVSMDLSNQLILASNTARLDF